MDTHSNTTKALESDPTDVMTDDDTDGGVFLRTSCSKPDSKRKKTKEERIRQADAWVSSHTYLTTEHEQGTTAESVHRDLAHISRREIYTDLIKKHWWRHCELQYAFQPYKILPPCRDDAGTGRHCKVHDFSLTFVKSLAVVAFWMDSKDAALKLAHRVKERLADRSHPNRARYATPADVKWVLLHKLEGVGAYMEWDQLCDDAISDRRE